VAFQLTEGKKKARRKKHKKPRITKKGPRELKKGSASDVSSFKNIHILPCVNYLELENV